MRVTSGQLAHEERAADVSSAEQSFFCRQDAGSTPQYLERLHDGELKIDSAIGEGNLILYDHLNFCRKKFQP